MTDEEKKQLADLEAKKKAAEAGTVETKIELTPEVLAMINKNAEELEKKFNDRLEENKKNFKFHGSAKDKKESEQIEKQLEVATFIKSVASGDHAKAAEISAKREKALNVTGNATGGYLVPDIFETEILATFDGYNEIIADADVKSYNKPGNIFNLNELDTRVQVFFVDENSTGLTGSTPSYSEPQIGISDLIGSTDMTLDFLEDTEVDIMDDLSKQYGEAMAQKYQPRLINGDVTVSGVVTKGIANTPGVNTVLMINTSSGYTGVKPADLEAMYFSAISIDHFQDANKNGKFYMNALTLQALRNNIRADTTQKDYLSVFDSAEMSILGRPIVITNQMPTPATTLSNPVVVYANLKTHLKVRRKRGLTMKVNDVGTSASGRNLNYQLGKELVVSQRIGHQVVLAEGITVLAT